MKTKNEEPITPRRLAAGLREPRGKQVHHAQGVVATWRQAPTWKNQGQRTDDFFKTG